MLSFSTLTCGPVFGGNYNRKPKRAEICIGTDEFHTPPGLRDRFVATFKKPGFSVAVDEPFSGSIVPSKFWEQDKRVQSLMIEVRRDLYMDEETGAKKHNFEKIREIIREVLMDFA